MRHYMHLVSGFALAGALLSGCLVGAQADAPAATHTGRGVAHHAVLASQDDAAKAGLKPEIEALLKASTAEYKKMRSYQHTAEYMIKGDRDGEAQETAYTLALERPNHFCFKSDESMSVAAVCNGKLFINLREKRYTRTEAPADYKGIDIVNDVTFDPIGTYLIALMLQGDALADGEIKAALMNASAPSTVVEEGKKYDTFVARIKPNGPPTTFYFDAQTHLLHKAVTKNDAQNGSITEIIENVKINGPISPAVFEYQLPKDAMLLTRIQRPTNRAQVCLVDFLTL